MRKSFITISFLLLGILAGFTQTVKAHNYELESVFSVTPVEPDIIPTDTGDVAPPTVIPGDSSAIPVEPDIIPTDTGEVAPPTVIPGSQTVYVPTIHEGDNVTEFEHNPVEGKAEQEFTFSLEGEELRIKGTLMARGYDKHYIHCQIIGDSVHLQRYDMDPKSTDMILHHIDIRIPGFTGDYYHVTLAEQNDIPLYKQYMVKSRTVMRNIPQKGTEFSITGTKWYSNHHYENFAFGRSDYSNETNCYSIGKDTLYNGEVWKSFYMNEAYLGAIREQDRQVWFYPNEKNSYGLRKDQPTLLYDFSLQVGDVIYENEFYRGYTKDISPEYIGPEYEDYEDYYEDFFYPITVKEVGEVCGRKVIKFDNGLQWIEGIGRIKFPFFSGWLPVPTDGSSPWEEVYQVESNGKNIYFNGEFANSESATWLEEGMVWTQNWGYGDASDGQFRQIMLKEEVRPGTFTVDWTELLHSNPYSKLQEFNGKVYAFDEYFYRFDLCYDFTLQEGDEVALLSTYNFKSPTEFHLPTLRYDTCTVSKVDLVEINGMARKRITLTGDREDVWVEGVGSLSRVFPIDGVETSSSVIYHPSRISCLSNDEKGLYLHPDFIDCTTPKANNVAILTKECANIQTSGSILTCTSPNAVKLEVYTTEAMKVGETEFTNGTATVKVSKVPATYLYIVTYPDGRRESGKVMVKE